jgi:histidinol-phosphatase (PHP family)
LRKPVAEIYPSPAFAEMCVQAEARFSISSDAHRPVEVGAGYEQALDLLAGLGVDEICVFEGRRRRLAPLGAEVGEDV